jgi:tripartite-type tricarboxylate transporter receptor subunit TctC
MRRILARAAGLVSGAVLALPPPTASAATPEEFYSGRQLLLIMSTDAGGGYASYANAFAPYLAAHIPGRPRITVQFMPGAGGLRAMNYLYASAPKDGSVIGMVHSGVPFAPLYGMTAANFDPREMGWIGSIGEAAAMCVFWHTSGVRTWQDMLTKPNVVGSSGAGSQMETFPVMLNKLFGTQTKVISGYKGGNEVYLAMERGEVDGRCGVSVSSVNATRPDWLPQNKVTVPIHIALERSPQFPDVPALVEFAKDEQTKQVLEFVLAPTLMDRPLLTPPGVPAERLAVLRAAFHAAVTDPKFLADARRQRIDVKEVPGARIEQVIANAFRTPPDVVRLATESLNLTGSSIGRGE